MKQTHNHMQPDLCRILLSWMYLSADSICWYITRISFSSISLSILARYWASVLQVNIKIDIRLIKQLQSIHSIFYFISQTGVEVCKKINSFLVWRSIKITFLRPQLQGTLVLVVTKTFLWWLLRSYFTLHNKFFVREL